MHEMTKKVEKTTLYRQFFEICSVTTFFKNPVCSVTKPSVTPPSIRALFYILLFVLKMNLCEVATAFSTMSLVYRSWYEVIVYTIHG